jgi:hypothetical protein
MVDPNAVLGQAGRLVTALTTAGLTRITVSEVSWKQPLPEPDDAWTGILASAVGGPIGDLDEERRRTARRQFITAMTNELSPAEWTCSHYSSLLGLVPDPAAQQQCPSRWTVGHWSSVGESHRAGEATPALICRYWSVD